MSRNKLNSGDGEGFLRALTDAWFDLEKDEDIHLQLMMAPTHRKGVVSIVLKAYEEGVEGNTEVVATYQTDYPSAAVSSLEATLYQSLIRLERIVVDARRWPSGRG